MLALTYGHDFKINLAFIVFMFVLIRFLNLQNVLLVVYTECKRITWCKPLLSNKTSTVCVVLF